MKVAVAIITDEQQRILVTQRPLEASHGGLWEFPGGKLEAGELAEQALVREIREEVGLEVLNYRYLGEIRHQYGDKLIQLIVFHVTQFEGTAHCREEQLGMRWVNKEDLDPNEFPEANHLIFKLYGG